MEGSGEKLERKLFQGKPSLSLIPRGARECKFQDLSCVMAKEQGFGIPRLPWLGDVTPTPFQAKPPTKTSKRSV